MSAPTNKLERWYDEMQALELTLYHSDFGGQVGAATPAGPHYFMLLDRNNKSGKYSHSVDTDFFEIHACKTHQLQENTTDNWGCAVGVITRLSATNGDWLGPCNCSGTTSSNRSLVIGENFDLKSVSTKVRDGKLVDLNGNTFGETNVSALQSDVTLKDIWGDSVLPEVGDVILRVGHWGEDAPTGQLIFTARCMFYRAIRGTRFAT